MRNTGDNGKQDSAGRLIVRRKRSASTLPPLPPPRIRVEGTNLTKSERALLVNPNWVTEDEADAIMAARAEKNARGRTYSLEEVLRENGLELVRANPARRAQTTTKPRRRRSA